MTVAERPVIAITMGDAAGVGPEVVAKALASEHIYDICQPLLVGEITIMQEVIDLVRKPLDLHPVKGVDNVQGRFGSIDILDMHNLDRSEVVVGQISAACGRAAMEYITEAARLVIEDGANALVTAPINKEATKQGGYEDIGHLEYLARITGTTEYATMLVSGILRTVHLTTHHSLRDACDLVKKDRILARIKLTHTSFRGWGLEQPRIAVAALNPHASEDGLLGFEESEEIEPAVKEARALGIDARGPFPADSVFNRAIDGEFDVVLAMYHDQGHIPIKVYGFEKSVSVALGLPFVRTSVDHGTAFDIAGKGIAGYESMVEAIRMAVRLCGRGSLTDSQNQ